MGKVFVWIVLAACLLSLVGCKRQATTATTATATTEQAVTTAPTQANAAPKTPVPENQLNPQDYAVAIAYAQWSGDSQLYMGGLNASTMSIDSVKHLPIYKLDSLAALESFRQTYSDLFIPEPNREVDISFDAIASDYTSDFFQEQSLLAVYISAGSSAYRFAVQSILAENGGLCVCFEETAQPEVSDTSMAGWIALIAVPKATLAQYQTFDAVLS